MTLLVPTGGITFREESVSGWQSSRSGELLARNWWNMHIWIAIVTTATIGLATAILVVGVYNRLVVLSHACENSFAQIEVQLKRRYDLIPMLVECVRGYLAHERDVLERLMAARNDAAAGLKAARRPRDAAAVDAWLGAEGALASALGHLSVVMEAYPSLQGNQRVAELTEELTSTENRIAFARQAYNDYVTGFNSFRQSFPNCVFADWFGFAESHRLLAFVESGELAVTPNVKLSPTTNQEDPTRSCASAEVKCHAKVPAIQ